MTDPTIAPGPAVDTAGLLEAAGRRGLRLSALGGGLEQTGLDFLVLRAVDQDGLRWILRAPRRPGLWPSMCAERATLSLIGPRLPVAVPDWRIVEPDLIAYPMVAGRPVVTVEEGAPRWHVIDPAAPAPVFIESFARALAALQAIPPEEVAAAGVPVKRVADARQSVARAMEASRGVLQPPEALWSRWRRWIEDDSLWPDHEAMTHGDLHPGHTLVDDAGQIVGLIDWTEAQLTDPSVDLAMFFGCFGRAAFEAMMAEFARAGGRVWPGLAEQATERWAASPAVGAEWALRNGNRGALEMARGMMAAIVQG